MGAITNTVEGNLVSFSSPAKADISSLKCYFEPIQEGTGDASPTNIRDISGWQGFNITYCGKNLFNIEDVVRRDGYILNDNGEETISSNGISGYLQNYIRVEPNTFYMIRAKIAGSGKTWRVYQYDINKNFISRSFSISGNTNMSYTKYKTEVNCYYISFQYIINDVDFSTFVIEKNDQLAQIPYIFYNGQTIPIRFPAVGKNLLDMNSVTVVYASSATCIGGIPSTSKADGSFILNAGTYTFSIDTTATAMAITNDQGSQLSYAFDTSSITFTLTKKESIRIVIGKNQTTSEEFEAFHYQVESGSSATTYEPFNNTIYGGYVDLISGQLVADRKLYTLDGTQPIYMENWRPHDNTVGWVYNNLSDLTDMDYTQITQNNLNDSILISDTLPTYYYSTALDTPLISKGTNGTTLNCLVVRMSDKTLTTSTAINNYLSQHPINIIYPLATPITYQLTPTQLQTFIGQNNIWSNANAKCSITYDIHETSQIIEAKKMIIRNQPHLVTAMGAIASFNTDMQAPLKSAKVYFNPVQEGSGDPSPSNIRAINGREGLSLYSLGKNIRSFKVDQYEVTDTYANGNNGWCAGISNSTALWGQTITYSAYIDATNATGDGAVGIIKSKADGTTFDTRLIGTKVTKGTSGWSQITIEIPGNGVRLFPEINAYKGCIFTKPMVELGNTRTEYEPYNYTPFSLDWSSTAETLYGGYVDLVKGELVEEWYSITFDGVNNKVNTSYVTGQMFGGAKVYLDPVGAGDGYSIASSVLCDTLPVEASSFNIIKDYPHLHTISNGNQYIRFYLWNIEDYDPVPSNSEIVAMTNQWLQDHPTQVVYKLKTPIVHSLTPVQIKSLIGANNIWSNANGNIEVKYWTH